jgi:hypothetical protein
MATGKSVNLRVRPVVCTDLCYPVNGIISKQSDTLLGSKVEGFDVEDLYEKLGQTAADGNNSRLLWDSTEIFKHLSTNPAAVEKFQGERIDLVDRPQGLLGSRPSRKPSKLEWPVTVLSCLRNAPEAADLDRALKMRQNTYLTSYSPNVLMEARRVYHDNPDDQSAVRHKLLKAVEDNVGQIHKGLKQGYADNGWWGIKVAAVSDNSNSANQNTGSDRVHFDGTGQTLSYGYEFRYPLAENELKYNQAKAAVRQEFLNAWRMSEMCKYGDTTFPNEIGAIDLSIRKLQAAYIDTFLFAPSKGIVTGVFHGQGDYVQAGEPVLRVENDTMIYLVGTVKYRGMLRIGNRVKVSTTLFETAGAAATTVSGKIVAVRGHDSVSEQWDLLIICSNRTDADEPILPLNYNFDFESTTIEIIAP